MNFKRSGRARRNPKFRSLSMQYNNRCAGNSKERVKPQERHMRGRNEL